MTTSPSTPISNDNRLRFMTVVLWAIAAAFVAYHYVDLPEIVPVHFGPDGIADRTGSKINIIIVLMIGLATSFVVDWVSRNPKYSNMPYKVAEEYKPIVYAEISHMTRILNVVVSLIFIIALASMIKGGQGLWGRLPVPIMGLLTLICVCLPFIKILELKKYSVDAKVKD